MIYYHRQNHPPGCLLRVPDFSWQRYASWMIRSTFIAGVVLDNSPNLEKDFDFLSWICGTKASPLCQPFAKTVSFCKNEESYHLALLNIQILLYHSSCRNVKRGQLLCKGHCLPQWSQLLPHILLLLSVIPYGSSLRLSAVSHLGLQIHWNQKCFVVIYL